MCARSFKDIAPIFEHALGRPPVAANADVTITSPQTSRGSCTAAMASCLLGTLAANATATVTLRVQPKKTLLN